MREKTTGRSSPLSSSYGSRLRITTFKFVPARRLNAGDMLPGAFSSGTWQARGLKSMKES